MKRDEAMIDKLFKYEAINGDGICPIYLHRWTLLATKNFKIYLHHFVGNDWALDPHDHPKRFISIGIWGEYYEDDYADLENPKTTLWRAPWIRTFPATHRHRLRMTKRKSCWTICIVRKVEREWGFYWNSKTWMPWKAYVWGGPGKERKDC